jgi:hypothetical protein
MKKLLKVLRWALLVLICAFVVAQFFGPARTNPAADPSQSIEAKLQVTPEVSAILDRSCNDCHSNKTRWPWYSHVAPVSWFVIDHVNEGRENLNFSEWAQYDKPDGLLRQICREVRAGAMPLSSYTPLHAGSEVSTEDRQKICAWTDAERARISEGK